MIKAIPTRYKGYHFRSRLEARWAVFFDALGVRWEYEPEGYQFRDGTRYLPDFWIPECNLFVEVKGTRPTWEEVGKCEELALATGKSAVLVFGTPYENPSWLCCWEVSDSGGGPWKGWASYLFPNSCAPEIVTHEDNRVERDRGLFMDVGCTYGVCATHSRFSASDERLPVHAMYAARSARFEFGQSGAAA